MIPEDAAPRQEKESFREQVERVIAMSRDSGETWDLSTNDQAALKAVLQRMAVLDAEVQMLKEGAAPRGPSVVPPQGWPVVFHHVEWLLNELRKNHPDPQQRKIIDAHWQTYCDALDRGSGAGPSVVGPLEGEPDGTPSSPVAAIRALHGLVNEGAEFTPTLKQVAHHTFEIGREDLKFLMQYRLRVRDAVAAILFPPLLDHLDAERFAEQQMLRDNTEDRNHAVRRQVAMELEVHELTEKLHAAEAARDRLQQELETLRRAQSTHE